MSNKNRWSKDRFLRELELLQDKDDYILSDYENINRWDSKFTVQCKKCSYIWQTNPNIFFDAESRCSNCNRGERWTLERFLKEIELLSDKDDYIFSDYENISSSKSKFAVQCKKCGYIWKVTPVDFFVSSKSRCSNCNRGERWSKDRFLKEVELLQDKDNYIFSDFDGITTCKSNFTVRCKKCDNVWSTCSNSFFTAGTRCLTCNESRGERRIALFLKRNNIKFQREKKFDACKNKQKLPFDFYLPDFNLILEFNGEQHYKKMTFSPNDETNVAKFERTKLTDSIKKQWAIENGYTFLEIRYDQINQIEEILTQELNL